MLNTHINPERAMQYVLSKRGVMTLPEGLRDCWTTEELPWHNLDAGISCRKLINGSLFVLK